MLDSWNWSWFIHDPETYNAVVGKVFGVKFRYNGIKFRVINTYLYNVHIYVPFLYNGKSNKSGGLSKINILPGTRFEGEFIPNPESFAKDNIEDGLRYPYSVILFGVTSLIDNGIINDTTMGSIQTYTTKII